MGDALRGVHGRYLISCSLHGKMCRGRIVCVIYSGQLTPGIEL